MCLILEYRRRASRSSALSSRIAATSASAWVSSPSSTRTRASSRRCSCWTVASTIDRPRAVRSPAPDRGSKEIVRLSRGPGEFPGSHAQIPRLDRLVADKLGRAGFVDDRALAHEVDVVGDAQGEGEVLLHDQDGRAAGLEPAEDAPELAHQEGGQALGGLVHHQDVGVADQRAPARQHLLLAAGELVAAVVDPLAQPREEIEHPAEAPARAVAGALADLEMFAHAERGKDAAPLRHQAQAAPRDLVRGQARDVLAAEQNAAAARRREADDRADQRGLADAVAAEHRDDLATADP